MTERIYQVIYLPYVGLDGNTPEVRFGKVRLVHAERLLPQVGDQELRNTVRQILAMHRVNSSDPGKGDAIPGIGIIVIGQADFREFNEEEQQLVRDFRVAIFLACLAQNARWNGSNAGSNIYASENFDVVQQRFTLNMEYITEVVGVIVRTTNMGFEIGKTRFIRPAHVLHPISFHTDQVLLKQLIWTRRHKRALYTRILRAGRVFLESYYNAENVDLRARILLEAAAFEILLDLPEQGQRKVFKDRIEQLTVLTETKKDGSIIVKERKLRYKFEMWDKWTQKTVQKPESRTIKAIWADRFYTLRNHIIHGNVVSASEWNFRGRQNHLFIAPLFFVQCVKALIDEARTTKGRITAFSDKVHWTVIREADRYEPEHIGFKVDTDFWLKYRHYRARKARRDARKKSASNAP